MSTDPRAERTRRQIRDSVLALAAEGGGELTVSAVARRAGVNRSSFYAHFESIDQVAIELLDESLTSIAELGWRARAGDRGPGARESRDLLSLVEHIVQQRTMYTAVLVTADSAPQAHLHVAGVLTSRFEQAFIRYGAARIVDATTVHATAIGVGAAMTAIVSAWLREDIVCSQVQLAEQLESTLPAWTRQLNNPHQGESHE